MIILSVLLSLSSVQTKIASYITEAVNDKFGTEIYVGQVDLSSLKNVKLKNVLINDHHQDTLISVAYLKTSVLHVRKMLQGNLGFGKIEIHDGKFLMKTYQGEKSNNLTIFTRKFHDSTRVPSEKPFVLTSPSVALTEVLFHIVDENKKKKPIVFYHHISGDFNDFKIKNTNVSANVRNLKTVENHKINIVNFDTDFSYSPTRMEFFNSKLKTDKSNVEVDLVFDYEEGDLLDFTDKVVIDATITKGDIILPDLKKLYKEFGRHDKIHFSAHMKGTINDFVLQDVHFTSDRNSSFEGMVNLHNVLHPEKFKMNAKIDKLSTSYDHLINMFPKLLKEKLPASIKKVGYFTTSGRLFLSQTTLDAKLNTKSQIGDLKSDIYMSNFNQKDKATYEGEVELVDFELGKFVGDSLIGELSMVGKVKGKGFSLNTVNMNVEGYISKHQYKGYTYTNINLNGALKEKHFNGSLVVNDPNIQLTFKGLADLSSYNYIFDFQADVSYANFYELNLFKRDSVSILRGKIDINLEGRTLDNIVGEINFEDASYTNQTDIFNFKNFFISSRIKNEIREVKINSTDIFNGSITGDFKFVDLAKLTQNSLGSLFDNYQKRKVADGQFLTFNFSIYNQIIKAFFPKIELAPNTIISGEVNSDEEKFVLSLNSPKIEAYDVLIDKIRLQIDNTNPIFNTLLTVNKIDSKYYNVANVNLVNVVLNDTLFIRTKFDGGRDFKENYNLSFYHTINAENKSVFGIKKSEMLVKNNVWHINPNGNNQNKFIFDHAINKYVIDKINLVSNNEQFVELAGFVDGEEDIGLDLNLKNVNLFDVTPAIDSLSLGGKVNGTINLKKVDDNTIPYIDLIVDKFQINEESYGDLVLNAYGDGSVRDYEFNAELKNNNLESFIARGKVNLTKKPTIDAEVKFDKFNISAFSPLGKNVLSKIRGLASGKAQITGLFTNPSIDGEISLKNAGVALPYLNVNYNFVGNSVVKLYDQTFDFQTIIVEDDVEKTVGVVKGTIVHENFKKWDLDLELSTDNLLILNTKETEDALYYGTGLLAGKTTIKGYTDELVINVVGRTNPGTNFVMPLSDVSTVNETNLIHFEGVDFIADEEKNKEDLVFEKLKGLSINFDLIVTKDAVAEIVVDKVSGSLLRGSTTGELKLNIDTNGKFEMYGVLAVEKGEYLFKNIVDKDFSVKKGGTIIWDGTPFEADLDIEAVYHTRANPSVLLDEIASSRKIDVDLITKITGDLSSPILSFNVVIPNASSNVTSELEFKLSNEDDMLTQFISLLVTGSFASSDKDKSNFNGNAALAGTVTQKASELLSNMLGSDNENFQVGVTYDIGTTNNVQDVVTDDQLGFEVSGRIGEKVIVNGRVGVPVGSNTSSSVIGEVEVVVPLNEAETFSTKVYNRQNEIEFDVADGEGYTQGVGITYLIDFNNGKEFLEKIGVKKTEEEKLLTKQERDSIKKESKILKKAYREKKKLDKKQ